MKLLLTSAGITNESIKSSLLNLVGKGFEEMRVAFITTASNPEPDKSAMERDYQYLISQSIGDIKKIDFTQRMDEELYNYIEGCDVIWMAGGNTFYLLHQLRITEFGEFLGRALEGKVYVGTSAGSIVATPTIAIAAVEPADPNEVGLEDLTGLCLVNFEVSPHTPELVPLVSVEKYSQEHSAHIFALDDKSAIEINEGDMVVVSEGFWKEIGVEFRI